MSIGLAALASACIWQAPRDLPLFETHALYARADLTLAPGEQLIVEGDFPHARQMSFNLHRREGNATLAAIHDRAIRPASGATNPFLPGADRTAVRRGYRFEVGAGAARDTGIALDLPAPTALRLLYRIYLPDRAQPGGGVPLPRLTRISVDGRVQPLPADCPTLADWPRDQIPGPTRIPPAPGTATDPIVWLGSATPAGGATGDLLVNRDNAYAYAMTDTRLGPLLLLQGRAPTHPRTRDGVLHAGDGEVRYWSICAYRHPSDRTATCLADEDVPLAAGRRYRVLAGPAGMRPPQATAACTIAWLPLPAAGEGVLLLRHVLPDPAFRQTPLGVPAGMDARPQMGDVAPAGRYLSAEEAHSLACDPERAA